MNEASIPFYWCVALFGGKEIYRQAAEAVVCLVWGGKTKYSIAVSFLVRFSLFLELLGAGVYDGRMMMMHWLAFCDVLF